jgi:hypothetical protein
MKRIIPLFALLFVFALGCVMAEQGHPVEPSGAGTETVLSQQDLGLPFVYGIAPETEVLRTVFFQGGEAACPLCVARSRGNINMALGIHTAEIPSRANDCAVRLAFMHTGQRLNC